MGRVMQRAGRLLCLLLALACLLSLSPAQALAAQDSAAPRTASNDKLIALTFDDGPGPDTARLLDALRARGAHCTFFMVGYAAKARPSVVKQCYEDGHQVASHTWDHPQLTKLSDEQIRKQLSDTAAVLDAAIGGPNTYMVRPPYGDFNDRVLKALGVPAFFWSDDSGDWQHFDADYVYNQLISTAGEGDILLLHDSHSWSVDAAIRAVDTLQSQGYEFVTVSELFRRRGRSLEAGKIYSWLRSTGICLPPVSAPKVELVQDSQGSWAVLTADEGTEIHYTLDGTVPNSASPRYTGPIPLRGTVELTAVAGWDMNGSRSELTRTTLRADFCKTPVLEISPEGLVTITGEETLCYTLDGSEPSQSSARYTGPFQVLPGTVVKAISCQPGGSKLDSAAARLCYSHRGNVFADVFPNQWYYGYLDRACSLGLLKGVGDHAMEPNEPTTRAMLAVILYRLAGSPKVQGSAPFRDVPAGTWYTKAVTWAQSVGVVKGYPDGSFLPAEALTREETVTMLARFARLRGLALTERAELSGFSDADRVSRFARSSMEWAVGVRLMKGVSADLLAPKDSATRAQLAALVLRLMELLP